MYDLLTKLSIGCRPRIRQTLDHLPSLPKPCEPFKSRGAADHGNEAREMPIYFPAAIASGLAFFRTGQIKAKMAEITPALVPAAINPTKKPKCEVVSRKTAWLSPIARPTTIQ
jgi:hypothetical protein